MARAAETNKERIMMKNAFKLTCRHCGARRSGSTDGNPTELVTLHNCEKDEWYIGAPALLTWEQEPPRIIDSAS